MKRKIKVNVMLLIGLSLLALTIVQPVNAENEQSVQSIIEQVQEHNLREEDVQEELEQLSISELKEIQEYLANKHDVTMIEKQVLNLTQDLLSNGSSVNHVSQENLNTADEENIPTQLLLGVGIVMFLTFGFGSIVVSLSNRLTSNHLT